MQSSTPSTQKCDHVSLAVSGTVFVGWHTALAVGIAALVSPDYASGLPYGITVPYRSHLEELFQEFPPLWGTGARHYFFFLVSDFGAVFLAGFWTPFAFVPDFAVFLTDAFVAGAAFAAFFAGDFLG